ncbi:uncharacterized protein [Henckelia pumila]|uniref:uncharacterized protein n=1 Tax=Henckelia pumila TaxID=405737 RepID=UPI003C6E19EC
MVRRTISERLHSHIIRKQKTSVVELKMLDGHLSPIRNQENVPSCSFIAPIACIEVLYRMFDKKLTQEWNGLYYFDFNECYDNLYKELNNLDDAVKLAKGNDGGRIDDTLIYAMDRGLLATTVFVEPRHMNHVAHFDKEAPRYHINGFKILKKTEVLECLKKFPIIAQLRVSECFEKYKKAIYVLSDEEVGFDLINHAVLVVGSVITCKDGEAVVHLIIQNTHGKKFGFKGFVLVPFDEKFTCFWLPLIYPHMQHVKYGKVERERVKVYSRRKRKCIASSLED